MLTPWLKPFPIDPISMTCDNIIQWSKSQPLIQMNHWSSHYLFYYKTKIHITQQFFLVFWLNIVENQVYLWYRSCLNLFGKMRRETNFGNTIAEILRKSRREKRKMMRWKREKVISILVLLKYHPKKKKNLTSVSVIVLPKYFPWPT